jgi:protocatechuate 3,4-dioxygenase beta subunit
MDRRTILRGASLLLVAGLAALVLLRPSCTGPGEGPGIPGPGPADTLFRPVEGDAARPAAAPSPGARSEAIRGVVVDGEGRPVAGAEVAAARDGERSPARATSDAAGTFTITAAALPAEDEGYLVGARASGYAPALVGGVRPGDRSLRIVLRRGMTLRGTVMDPAGAPCPGARVRLTLRFPGLKKPLGGFEAMADEDGRYLFHGLTPVEGALEATFRGSSSGEVPFSPPTGGNEMEIDLRVETGPTIEGTVRSAAGDPLPGIMVSATPVGRPGTTWASTDASGRYAIRGLAALPHDVRATDPAGQWLEARVRPVTPPRADVDLAMAADPEAPGAYSFRAVDAGGRPAGIVRVLLFEAGNEVPAGSGSEQAGEDGVYGPDRCGQGRYRITLRGSAGLGASEEFAVERGKTTDLGTLRLSPGVQVRGRIFDPRGRPCPGAQVFVGDDPIEEPGVPDAGGRFMVDSLPPGAGLLRILLPRCDPLEAAWNGGPGDSIDLGDLDLRTATGILRGTVRDRAKAPVAGAIVRVLTPRILGKGELDLEAVTGPDGRFEVRSVPAGRWKVAAAPPPPKEGTNFLGGRATPLFTLGAGETKEMDLLVE